MDSYIYTLNNPSIHCVIQEKDQLICRQTKEIDDLQKANQMLAKDNDRLRADLDLQKKLSEALEKFKYTLERHVAVLKDYDKNRWSLPDVESEVRIWEHEYLMIRKMLEKKEREEQALIMGPNGCVGGNGVHPNPVATNQPNSGQTPPKQRRSAPKPKTVEVGADGTALKRYVCDFPNCSYRSNWAHDLKGHKRKHTGEKPYTCGWLNCNKSFRDLRDLKRHQRAHTGDKRYSCDWPGCEYRSTDVANLAKHKRTHTGERPYKCDWAGCEASFADGSHLRRHQKKHENQMTKLTKTASPSSTKKRQTPAPPKTTGALIKTRQQPGRRAKGSGVRVPLEMKVGLAAEDKSDLKGTAFADNDRPSFAVKSCPTVGDNNGVNASDSQRTHEKIVESDVASKTTIERVVASDAHEVIVPELNNRVIDMNISSDQPKEQMGDNSSLMSRMDMNSGPMDESNRHRDVTSDLNDQQMSLMSDDNRQCFVITSTMMANTTPNLNSSPLTDPANKEPIVRYSDIHGL